MSIATESMKILDTYNVLYFELVNFDFELFVKVETEEPSSKCIRIEFI